MSQSQPNSSTSKSSKPSKPSKKEIKQPENDSQWQFLLKNYNDYFHKPLTTELFDQSDPTHALIAELFQVLSENSQLYSINKLQGVIEVYIDIYQLFKCFGFEENGDIKLDCFIQDSENWISATALSLHHIIKENKRIIARFFNFNGYTPIRAIRSNDIGSFITITGVILQIGSIRIILTRAYFNCTQCSTSQITIIQDGVVQQPKYCIADNCSCTQFFFDRIKSETILYQRVKLQEIDLRDESINQKGQRIPMTITVEIRDNLVGTFISGDPVTVSGVLKTEADIQQGVNKNVNALYTKYIEANSVFLQKDKGFKGLTQEDEQFTQEEIEILNFHMRSQTLFEALIKAFCPAIFGQELVKAGLLLCLVGNNNNQKRCNSHCLMIGEPGQGKSQLLKFISLISPRAVYVSGTSTSQCGLTCSVNRKDDNLDAGALVMADQGICLIDEFDKMQNEHVALLEAMEQQTVSLAKAGVMCQLQARTSVIAAANPEGGSYKKNKSFMENLKIANTILSRFDLIFLMLDEPDPLRDEKLSKHILELHNNNKKRTRQDFESDQNHLQVNLQAGYIYESLAGRLEQQCETIPGNYQIDLKLLKKFIYHASQKQQPNLTSDASKILADYYVKIRQQNVSGNVLPVTTRQLESLIRLSQAKAKLDMRNLVLPQDATFIIQLIDESKFDCFSNYSSEIRKMGRQLIDKNNVGNLSKQKQAQIFLETLKEQAEQTSNWTFTIEQLKDLSRKINLQVGDFLDFIKKLNEESYIIRTGVGIYELKYGK